MNAAEGRMYGTTLTRRMETTAAELDSLDKAKAPYEKKAKVIRSAKLPKALYGCEVAPVNETALRQLRTAVTKTVTFTTEQRSSDLTFATASHGPDLDPESSIFARRATALSRFINKSVQNEERVKTIMKAYRKNGEPGIYVDEEQLREKKIAGDPATAERAEVRNQCLKVQWVFYWSRCICRLPH